MIRGSNPVWLFDDLAGNILDDTYYMFVLQNTFPYLPSTDVWHDSSGTIPWNQPIRFFSNGTLPIDIYFDPTVVYRLEIRHGANQSEPLIYLVENYVPGSSGSIPIDTVATVSDNQITNAQFSLLNIPSPYVLTAASTQVIDIAPGWSLDLTGTGNVTITQVPLNNDAADLNGTNAPYALEINLSGTWTKALLIQRFNENGMLWANKTVASSVTAKIPAAPQPISAALVDSNGTTLASVLDPVDVTSSFEEYLGFGTLGATSNPDVPPVAYIEYQLLLPNTVDIFLTSFQLVVSAIATVVPYVQDSIQRQQDYTWHYYRNSVVTQPKESLLTGWDFGLNPWQFSDTASTTLTDQCSYTADQTIVYQQAGGSEVAAGQAIAAENYAFEITAIGNNSRFAIIQYIDPSTVRDVWGYTLSSLVRAWISSPTHHSTVRFKMRLIYRDSLPSTIGAAEPVASWTGAGNPTFSAGWTAIAPTNDPAYTLGAQGLAFPFEGMTLPAATSDDMTLGIVVYTIDGILEAATADRVLFERVSLCRNDFAIDGQLLTFDETLRRCQYYFESSKDPGILPTTSGGESALLRRMDAPSSGGNTYLLTTSFGIQYNSVKRLASIITFYEEDGTIDNITGYTFQGASGQISSGALAAATLWNQANNGLKAVQYIPKTSSHYISTGTGADEFTEAFISFHFTADSRMGI